MKIDEEKINVQVQWTKTNKAIKNAIVTAFLEQTCKRPVLTSGSEGTTHAEESGHYHGRALDYRRPRNMTRYRAEQIKKRILEILKESEGEYKVIIYSTHFHIQREKNSF